jgi:hypothetical protein
MNPSFAVNLADMPRVDDLLGMELSAPDSSVVVIENKSGSQGSLRLYRHLLNKHGLVNAAAAAEGLALYAEHTQDARLNPGKHPNIDRLLEIESGGLVYSVRLLPVGASAIKKNAPQEKARLTTAGFFEVG